MPPWKNVNEVIKFLKSTIESYDEIYMIYETLLEMKKNNMIHKDLKVIPKGIYKNVYLENILDYRIITESYIFRHDSFEKKLVKKFSKYKDISNSIIVSSYNLYFGVIYNKINKIIIPNIILSTLFDYLTSMKLNLNSIKEIRSKFNKFPKLDIFTIINLEFIKILYNELFNLPINIEYNNNKSLKKKGKKITNAVIEYMGESDIIPYTLQIPIDLCNDNNIDILSLNLSLRNSRNYRNYCVLGWLDQHLSKFDIVTMNNNIVFKPTNLQAFFILKMLPTPRFNITTSLLFIRHP